MTGLSRYTVDSPGGEIVVQLSDREAEARGLKKAAAKKTATAQGGKSTAAKRAEVSDKSFVKARRRRNLEPGRAGGSTSSSPRTVTGLGRGVRRRRFGHAPPFG